jgi:hypothetical protein
VSKYRRADADAAIADLLARNPQLAVKDDGRNRDHPAAYRLTEAKPAHTHVAPTEHEEQCALFAWAAANEAQAPELACMFAVPNGGYRPMTTAAALKAEGVKSGVPDCCLPVARGRFHSLWLEIKRANHSNHATPEQKEWIDRLRSAGHMAVVCYGADEAIKTITHYLSLEGGHA